MYIFFLQIHFNIILHLKAPIFSNHIVWVLQTLNLTSFLIITRSSLNDTLGIRDKEERFLLSGVSVPIYKKCVSVCEHARQY